MCLTSCGFKSKEVPLTDNLTSFTAEGPTKGAIYTGVKDNNGKVIVSPGDYVDIKANDDGVISCQLPESKGYTVYKCDGNYLGTYKMFTEWQSDRQHYCIGVDPNDVMTYYFPKTDKLVETSDQIGLMENILLHTNNGWEVYDYIGNVTWSALPETFYVIKNAVSPGEWVIAIPADGKVKTCNIHDKKGEVIKKLTALEWKSVSKELEEEATKGTVVLAKYNGKPLF